MLAALSVAQGDVTVSDVHFSSGETLPEVRLHYRTWKDQLAALLERSASGR